MSLVARITALAQAVGADIKALSANMLDLAGSRRMTGPVRFAAAPEVVLNNGQLDLAAATSNSVRGRIDGPILDLGSLPAGEVRTVRFLGGGSTAKLVYSYASIRLPANADISLSEGDTAEFYSIGNGTWELRFFQRQDGTALVGTAAPVSSVAGKTGAVTLAKGDVGLGNVDNTSDANKPVSIAQQTALDQKVDKVVGKGLSTEDYSTSEKSKLAGIAAGAQVNSVTSVAGKTGVVALAKGDVGLSNVDNTSDANKPVSTAQTAAIKATGWGLEVGGDQSPTSSDANIVLSTGTFRMSSAGLNKPTSTGGLLIVYKSFNTSWIQHFIIAGTSTTWTRTSTDGSTWTAWGSPELYGLGVIAPVLADANLVAGSQFATLTGSGLNLPLTAYGALWHHQALSSAASQFYNATTSGRLWNRTQGSNVWNRWREIAFLDDPSFTGNLLTTGTFSGAGGSTDPDVGVTLGSRAFGANSLPGTAATQVGFKTQLNYARTLTGTAIGYYARDSFGDNSATAGVLSRYFGFNAEAAALGANQTITTHYGFYANSQPAGVGTAYGFLSNMAVVSGKERWNCYMQGTAPNYMAGDLRLGTITQSGTDLLTAAGSLSATGPVKCGQYTLTTLPSASAFNGYEIDVTNATGGPKRCRSNGTNWIILNTTTIVS